MSNIPFAKNAVELENLDLSSPHHLCEKKKKRFRNPRTKLVVVHVVLNPIIGRNNSRSIGVSSPVTMSGNNSKLDNSSAKASIRERKKTCVCHFQYQCVCGTLYIECFARSRCTTKTLFFTPGVNVLTVYVWFQARACVLFFVFLLEHSIDFFSSWIFFCHV